MESNKDVEHINEIRRLLGYDVEEDRPKLKIIEGGQKNAKSTAFKRRFTHDVNSLIRR